ncbi:hypothetical protein HDF16_002113 [Granulicella aggregans]|uniref:Uncharacterized protein n=1 Tax=Granulicella aggregans TaxID=474949 RepID=A0A7W8E3B3_9BACT|nr:hypothetical protein [Granulicella aggregans]
MKTSPTELLKAGDVIAWNEWRRTTKTKPDLTNLALRGVNLDGVEPKQSTVSSQALCTE